MDKKEQHFTSLEKTVYDNINNNLDFFVSNNLNVLAKSYYVGEATIIRLVKKLGFDSLKKMQLSYANKISIDNISKIELGENQFDLNNLVQETSALSLYPILETVKDFDYDNLDKIINHIKTIQLIVIFSTGNANYAAQYLYRNLLSTEKQILKIDTIDEFFKIEQFYSKQKVAVIIFSNSGLKKEVIKVFNDTTSHNWTTIWIGSTRSLMHETPLIDATYKLSYKVHYVEKNFYPATSAINGQIFMANVLTNCLLKTSKNASKKIEKINENINKWHFE